MGSFITTAAVHERVQVLDNLFLLTSNKMVETEIAEEHTCREAELRPARHSRNRFQSKQENMEKLNTDGSSMIINTYKIVAVFSTGFHECLEQCDLEHKIHVIWI